MNDELNMFLMQLKKIQKEVIQEKLCCIHNYNTSRELLADSSYEIIYRITELIDGYYNEDIKYIITDLNNIQINANVDIHDLCEDYLES